MVQRRTLEVTRGKLGQTAEGGSQRKVNHVKSETSNQAPLNSTFREGSSGKQRRKSAQSLSPRTATSVRGRRGTRRGTSLEAVSPTSSFGPTKIRTWVAERRTRITWNSWTKRQVARGPSFVHELRPEVNSIMKCVAKISWPCQGREQQWRICACLGWPHAMKEDQDSSKQVYGRSPTGNKLEWRYKVNAQARIETLVSTRATQLRKGTNRNMGTSSCSSHGGTAERESAGPEDGRTEEESKGCKEDSRECSRK